MLLPMVQHPLPLMFAHIVNLKAIDFFSPTPKAAYDSTVLTRLTRLKILAVPTSCTHIYTHTWTHASSHT